MTTARSLPPQTESETREVKYLNGIWNFVKSNETNPTEGVRDKWYLKELSKVRLIEFGLSYPSYYKYVLDEKDDSNARTSKLQRYYRRQYTT